MSNLQSKQRIVFLDYVRVVACFLVLMVHSSESQYGTGDILLLSEQHALWIAIWNGISRISVPLFIITSSYLLVPLKEGVSWGKFYSRRFLRILPPMVVFMIIYTLFPAITGNSSWKDALVILSRIPLNFPDNAFHLWFMYPLIGLYLLIPILSPWLRTATEKQERMFLILWAITTCLPIINKLYGNVFGQCWWNEYHMLYDFSGYPGYLVLGHYLRTHVNWSMKRRKTVGSLCLIVGWTATVLSFYLQAKPNTPQLLEDVEIAWGFCIINCVIATFGAFLLLSTITYSGKMYGVVKSISHHSYGIYLMHLLWMMGLWAPLINPVLPVVLSIPIVAILTYVSSYVTTRVLSFLPGSKWFIGS